MPPAAPPRDRNGDTYDALPAPPTCQSCNFLALGLHFALTNIGRCRYRIMTLNVFSKYIYVSTRVNVLRRCSSEGRGRRQNISSVPDNHVLSGGGRRRRWRGIITENRFSPRYKLPTEQRPLRSPTSSSQRGRKMGSVGRSERGREMGRRKYQKYPPHNSHRVLSQDRATLCAFLP